MRKKKRKAGRKERGEQKGIAKEGGEGLEEGEDAEELRPPQQETRRSAALTCPEAPSPSSWPKGSKKRKRKRKYVVGLIG